MKKRIVTTRTPISIKLINYLNVCQAEAERYLITDGSRIITWLRWIDVQKKYRILSVNHPVMVSRMRKRCGKRKRLVGGEIFNLKE